MQVCGVQADLMIALADSKLNRFASALGFETSAVLSIALRVIRSFRSKCVHEYCKGRAAADDDGFTFVSIIIYIKGRLNLPIEHSTIPQMASHVGSRG
jgi:hypothetical protein